MRKHTYDKTIITKEFLQSRYEQGFTRADIAREFDLHPLAIKNAEHDLGVILPERTGRKGFYNVSEKFRAEHAELFNRFLELHKSGLSFAQIAETCGCSASQVGKIFTIFGYSFDTAYKTKAAHAAIKGSKRSYEDLCKRALGKQNRPPKMSRWEIFFSRFLTEHGIPFTYSRAVGKYNVDFAIGDSVAVELFGGAYHATGRAAARTHERMKYLLESGWNVYIVWCLSKESGIFPACLDDFLTFLEEARRNESAIGKYRVIWSDGDPVSAGSLERDYLAVVRPAAFRHEALSKYKAARN